MSAYSRLPSVDRLLTAPALLTLGAAHGRASVTAAVREELAQARAAIAAGASPPAHEDLLAAIVRRIEAKAAPRLRSVYNLSGTVLHTNLGRAPLPPEALLALQRVAQAPCALEYDLLSGGRGERDEIVAELLCELTGAAAATVVNNNAAAVFLLLNSLASRKEVLVSRGELVEIGGAFRIPDIMQRAGARLVEVGTTNRTHLADFEAAIGPRTALLMKVHASNYAIHGFTAAVAEAELAALAGRHGLPLAVDLGAGALVDLARWGLPHEPTVRESLTAGAALVSFSADKLLGGPQAGLLVGERALIDTLRRNPLRRALRVGKLTLAALEAVLRLYRDPERLPEKLTTLALLTRPQSAIAAAAQRLCPALRQALADQPVSVEVLALSSQIGSGAMPVDRLPSAGLGIRADSGRGGPLKRIEAAMRRLPRPVIGRLGEGALRLDLRCLSEEEEAGFLANLAALSC